MKAFRYLLLFGIGYALCGCALFTPSSEPIPNKFEVFFDIDRATISDSTAQTIQDVATLAKQNKASSINLMVHTDNTGRDAPSRGLAERRANAIKAELIKDGVPEDAITRVSAAETEQIAPTADGMPEPKNRRTEIILR